MSYYVVMGIVWSMIFIGYTLLVWLIAEERYEAQINKAYADGYEAARKDASLAQTKQQSALDVRRMDDSGDSLMVYGKEASIEHLYKRLSEADAEIEELKKDRKRIDWLAAHSSAICISGESAGLLPFRSSIDAAIEREAKGE